MKALRTVIALIMVASGRAEASYVDDQSDLNLAVSQLRSAMGKQARVREMWIQPGEVSVEVQDPDNLGHLNRWRFVRIAGILPWVFGPEHADYQRDPDLGAKLFDLDAVAFSEMSKLEKSAIKRAAIADGAVTLIAIVRAIPVLSKAVAGDIFVSLHIEGARERADVNANAQCVILGGEFSETEHAKTFNLFKEPDLIAEAAAAFRDMVGTGPVLTQVWVEARSVGFETNISTAELKKQLGAEATFGFEWGLDGLVQRIRYAADQRLGRTLTTQTPEKPSFNIADVDWTIIAKLESDALAKVAIPNSQVTGLILTKLNAGGQGGPVVTWVVDVTAPDSKVTDVVADAKGGIETVVLPSPSPQSHR
ncbi:MAG: hypothetical protein WAK31_26775 [Chthoniobacterales bacterium]